MTHPTDALRLVPVDTGPNFSDSSLPLTMIHAGADAIDRATDDMANYVSGETIDWDSGMMAVAVYRAMLSAAPASPLPEGGGLDEIMAILREEIKCDATGLAPAVASIHLIGFERAAERILALPAAPIGDA